MNTENKNYKELILTPSDNSHPVKKFTTHRSSYRFDSEIVLTPRARLPLRSGTESENEKRNGTTHSYCSSAYPTARKQKQHGIRRNKRNSQKHKKTSCFKSMTVSRGKISV